MNKYTSIFILLGLFLMTGHSFGASRDSIIVTTEYDYYTSEDTARILVYIPGNEKHGEFSIHYMGDTLVSETVATGLNYFSVEIKDWVTGKHLMVTQLNASGEFKETALVLQKLEPRLNEVKINRTNGSLIADGLPFYPFGFYCYWPVQPTLPEEEVVRGFNMLSPYQKIEGKTLNDRKKYMDRCARLGMKVHYNLLSVSGGGGVGSGRLSDIDQEEKRRRLIREVNTFKDHPALLAWYISDEPVGQGIPPEPLIEMYRFIKELDPYHPVSIVFMTPQKAQQYAGAMDIVMADPYPIPGNSVSTTGRVTKELVSEFYLEKPVWIVPQAFGGNEWWAREPTAQEIRVMTYLAMVEGAQGIQYFIRHGMNAFPKSVVAWNECSNMAHEVAELTPALSQGTLVASIRANHRSIKLRSLLYKDCLTILAVNTENKPKDIRLDLGGFRDFTNAEVLFENRKAVLRSGILSDQIEGFGTRVYRLARNTHITQKDKFHEYNMVVNPGFEQLSSPLIPSGSYARLNGDRGATYFVDSRVFFEGRHALRLVTPEDHKGIGLSFFPVAVKNGFSYTVEVRAKAKDRDPHWEPYEQNWFRRLIRKIKTWLSRNKTKDHTQKFVLKLGTLQSEEFELSKDWRRYGFSVYVDDLSGGMQRVSPYLELLSEGTAWFDNLQVYPDMNIKTRVQEGGIQVVLENHRSEGLIRYETDSSAPDISSPVYSHPFTLYRSAHLFASVFVNDSCRGKLYKELTVHDGLGAGISLINKYHARYQGIGKQTLVDGTLASKFFKDAGWLGFKNQDLAATIDLGLETRIKDISVTFLQDHKVDIFLPGSLSFEVSADGSQYDQVYLLESIEAGDGPPERTAFSEQLVNVEARYVRIRATNRKEWLFVDEIVINRK